MPVLCSVDKTTYITNRTATFEEVYYEYKNLIFDCMSHAAFFRVPSFTIQDKLLYNKL